MSKLGIGTVGDKFRNVSDWFVDAYNMIRQMTLAWFIRLFGIIAALAALVAGSVTEYWWISFGFFVGLAIAVTANQIAGEDVADPKVPLVIPAPRPRPSPRPRPTPTPPPVVTPPQPSKPPKSKPPKMKPPKPPKPPKTRKNWEPSPMTVTVIAFVVILGFGGLAANALWGTSSHEPVRVPDPIQAGPTSTSATGTPVTSTTTPAPVTTPSVIPSGNPIATSTETIQVPTPVQHVTPKPRATPTSSHTPKPRHDDDDKPKRTKEKERDHEPTPGEIIDNEYTEN